MSDFDPTTLDAELALICSVTYAGAAGSFYYGGGAVTYQGVFNQTNAEVVMVGNGYTDDAGLTLVFNRTALTPSVNVSVFRIFDGSTYRILGAKPDEQGWECTLERIR